MYVFAGTSAVMLILEIESPIKTCKDPVCLTFITIYCNYELTKPHFACSERRCEHETLFFPPFTLLFNFILFPFEPFYLASSYVLLSILFSLFPTFTDRNEPLPTDAL